MKNFLLKIIAIIFIVNLNSCKITNKNNSKPKYIVYQLDCNGKEVRSWKTSDVDIYYGNSIEFTIISKTNSNGKEIVLSNNYMILTIN